MLYTETVVPDTMNLLIELQHLPLLQGFRLVGGTALALQLGHRISIDLDLFGTDEFDSLAFQNILIHRNYKINTLKDMSSIHIYQLNNVKVDIVVYPYQWLKEPVLANGLVLASIEDIAAMKISAIIGRGSKKDFIDLSVLLDIFPLKDILEFFLHKYPTGTLFTALKSLTYFEDAESTPMPHLLRNISWDECKNQILEAVRTLA